MPGLPSITFPFPYVDGLPRRTQEQLLRNLQQIALIASDDHGGLTGLGDDDHPHYYNQARGDARYSQLGHTHTLPVRLWYPIGDETTVITTGNNKLTVRAPYAFSLTAVRFALSTASSSGLPTFDVNLNGTTIFSTKATIDVSERTTVSAATQSVLSTSPTVVADDDEFTVDFDVAGTGAAGVKMLLLGTKSI